jgi:hypothetical protein
MTGCLFVFKGGFDGVEMVRKVSIRRDSMTFSRPCWEMSGKIVDEEPVPGTASPWVKRLVALA